MHFSAPAAVGAGLPGHPLVCSSHAYSSGRVSLCRGIVTQRPGVPCTTAVMVAAANWAPGCRSTSCLTLLLLPPQQLLMGRMGLTGGPFVLPLAGAGSAPTLGWRHCSMRYQLSGELRHCQLVPPWPCWLAAALFCHLTSAVNAPARVQSSIPPAAGSLAARQPIA